MPAGRTEDPESRTGERSPRHPAGGKVPSGEADAGLSGKAGSVSGAHPNGQFDPGSGACQGRIPAFDGKRGEDASKDLILLSKRANLEQKDYKFFVEKRKNILHFAETADII